MLFWVVISSVKKKAQPAVGVIIYEEKINLHLVCKTPLPQTFFFYLTFKILRISSDFEDLPVDCWVTAAFGLFFFFFNGYFASLWFTLGRLVDRELLHTSVCKQSIKTLWQHQSRKHFLCRQTAKSGMYIKLLMAKENCSSNRFNVKLCFLWEGAESTFTMSDVSSACSLMSRLDRKKGTFLFWSEKITFFFAGV